MKKRLEVKNLKKSFNNKEILKDISFSLYPNEIVALVGGNGAGKSTMLDILGKVSKEYSGTIDYHGLKDDEIGVMFQSSSFPTGIKVKHLINFAIKTHSLSLTEKESLNKQKKQKKSLKQRIQNLQANFEQRRIHKKETKKEIDTLAKKYTIDGLMNKSANRLSGGERQRVSLLLSMIHKPKVLYLDEPTAGLDIESKNVLINLLKDEIKSRSLTVVIVTHEMAAVEKLIDRILILKKGILTYDEPIKKFKGKFSSIDDAIESKVFGGDK